MYETITVKPNSREWLLARKTGLGASDTAAILGLSKWATPWSIYQDKLTDLVEDMSSVQEWGHRLEPAIAGKVEDEGFQVREVPGMYRSVDHPHLLATLDREVLVDGVWCPLELKTSDARVRQEWDRGVPLGYQVQVQQQMLVTGAGEAYLAVLHGGNDFELHHVAADEEFQAYLIEQTTRFWEHNVQAHVPPPPTVRDNLSQVYPGQDGTETEATEEVAGAWIELGQVIAALTPLEAQKEELTRIIQGFMQESAALTYEGDTLATWKPAKPRELVDTGKLKAEYPDIYEQVRKLSKPSRRFVRKTAVQIERKAS